MSLSVFPGMFFSRFCLMPTMHYGKLYMLSCFSSWSILEVDISIVQSKGHKSIKNVLTTCMKLLYNVYVSSNYRWPSFVMKKAQAKGLKDPMFLSALPTMGTLLI